MGWCLWKRRTVESGIATSSSTGEVPAALITLLILCSVTVLTALLWENYKKADSEVRHTYQVIGNERKLLAQAEDVETGHRGFAITGDE